MAEQTAPRQLVELNPLTPWWSAPIDVIRNAWGHRSLIRTFVGRDLRIRYRNSVLGYLWSLIEPLLLTATYYVLFTVIAGRAEPRYPLWVLVGVLVWGYFANSMTKAMGSLSGNAGLIKQIYFPRELFAITNTLGQLVITGLSLLVVIPFLFYYGTSINANLLLVPAGLLMAGVLGLGVGLAFSCLNAVHRDVEHFTKFVVRAGFFLSPVMWTLSHLDGKHAKLIDVLLLNPMVVPITMVRCGIEGRPLPDVVSLQNVLYSLGVCVGMFAIGTMFFKRFEGEAVKHI